jgi:hypothetical protein
MSAQAEGFGVLLSRLRAARRSWLAWRFAAACGEFLGAVSLLVLLLLLAETVFRPSPAARFVLVYAAALPGALFIFLKTFCRAATGSGLRATARLVQSKNPRLGSRLECALDLAAGESSPLVDAALAQAAASAKQVDFGKSVRLEKFLRRHLPHLACVLVLALVLVLFPQRALNAWQRLLAPASTQETVGTCKILKIIPGDAKVVEGSDLPVSVEVDAGVNVRHALLKISKNGKEEQLRRLARIDENRFGYTLRSLREGFDYRLEIDDTASSWRKVTVIPRPAVNGISGTVFPPAYTGIEPFALAGADGSIRAPAGSRVELSVATNHAVMEGHARLSSGQTAPLMLKDGKLVGAFEISASGTYTVSLLDKEGNTNENPIARPIDCLPDKLPQVRFGQPASPFQTGLNTTVQLRIIIEDDYGIGQASLFFRRNKRGEPQLLKRWDTAGGNARELNLSHALELNAPDFDVGDSVSVYCEASDFGVGKDRVGRSAPMIINIENPQKEARKDVKSIEQTYRLVEKILAEQKSIHAETVNLPASGDKLPATAQALCARQLGLRAALLDAAAAVAEVEHPAASRIRLVLRGLSVNECPEAAQALNSLSGKTPAEERSKAVASAVKAQGEVIKRLVQILGILPELREKIEEPAEKEEGEDLESDAPEELRKIKDALDKFKDEQKKVVEATKDLAKKDVDDFTEADKEKLADLAAKEENWANFLKDLGSDLSKVPKQDFSNPSLLGEVIAVLEEVELAAGSMKMKEMEISTFAATTGLELAESMTTHLEKWLSDKPDRIAWKMEEPLKDYDMPMAEMPDKLEDIIGELVEQEEELMEEIDDTSSSWADSLDKGAGWDALDGPMSNYSAQGVTGNHLPNNTEIGGRSGEGRQGRAHGEMVSDTAVGKGGRRTPSRLAPDTFEKGEINDQSKDASGGATGGGKGGAAGAEGLEGPAAPADKGPLPRLMGKQTELRNRAERINLNLKMMGYNTSVLENTLSKMRTVEQDLKSGRYRSASRQAQHSIDSLKTASDAVLGEATVRADRASGLPRDLQREIVDALDAGMPKGYEDLVKAYYEKLADENAGQR